MPERLVSKSVDLRSLISGDINEEEEDAEEEVEFPESGEWCERVTEDRFGKLLHDNPFPKIELPRTCCWLFCDDALLLVKSVFTKEGGDGFGGFTTFVQLTRSASSGPTMSLKSSKDSSVNGRVEG